MQLQLGTPKRKTKKMSKVLFVAMKVDFGNAHGEFIAREIARFLTRCNRPVAPVELDGIQNIMLFTNAMVYDIFTAGEEYKRWRNRIMDFEVL